MYSMGAYNRNPPLSLRENRRAASGTIFRLPPRDHFSAFPNDPTPRRLDNGTHKVSSLGMVVSSTCRLPDVDKDICRERLRTPRRVLNPRDRPPPSTKKNQAMQATD